jgi:uncharacterized membrane protein YqhA
LRLDDQPERGYNEYRPVPRAKWSGSEHSLGPILIQLGQY